MGEIRWGRYVRGGEGYSVELTDKRLVISCLEPQGVLVVERWDAEKSGYIMRPQEETERIARERGATIIAKSHCNTRRLRGLYLLFSEKPL